MVFLEKTLFTAYTYSPVASEDDGAEESEVPPFQISLSSLLETLQIFGINDVKDRWSSRDPNINSATGFASGSGSTFGNTVLDVNGICRLSYDAIGEPLRVILKEAGVTTTCELATYEPELQEEIPLQADAIAQKIIMRASWLDDAVAELSSTSPTRLTIVSAPTMPFFALSSNGPLGSATVEFSKDPQLLETFHVPRRIANTYKYSLIKSTSKAMAIATKVCIRSDDQGVLSLQFLVEIDGSGNGYSFVDFRFVPYIPEEGEGDEDSEVDEAE